MSPAFLTSASQMICPHGGTVQAVPASGRMRAGDAVLATTDTFLVKQCTFSPGGPHPCVIVQWQSAAQRVRRAGAFALTEASLGLCVAADGAVQGFVKVVSTQSRAGGL